jgi:hypothetical protein
VNDAQADESNIDEESDNESQTTNTSMVMETKPIMSQGCYLFIFYSKIKFSCFQGHRVYFFLLLQLRKNETMKNVS